MHEIKPCREFDDLCRSWAPGHAMHWVHANCVGRRPWGWRDAIITRVEERHLTAEYVGGEGRVIAWHHRRLGALRAGSPVRVHEEYHALGAPVGWFNVALVEGCGPVPAQAHPELWLAERAAPIVHVTSGAVIAVDHRDAEWPQEEGATRE